MANRGPYPRQEAQELAWDAMEALADEDVEGATAKCRQALDHYPDCVDARLMLAEIEIDDLDQYIDEVRETVTAGEYDLGSEYFENEQGNFWLIYETRPLMRAMESLALALVERGTQAAVDEAIAVMEEMLELNPNDNQGVRDVLVGCHLQQKRYADAAALLERYDDDWLATMAWARVLLAHATGDEAEAGRLLEAARARNPHVELYLTGRKRRPRDRPAYYSPGDEAEAVFCADHLWEAWKRHPAAKRWLKGEVAGGTGTG